MSSNFTSDPEPLQRLLASAYVVQESGISTELLASIAELQQQIEFGDLTLDEATQRIVQRAVCVADASGTAVALLKADQLVYNAGSGSAASYVGRRVMATLTASATLEARAEILRVEDADSDARIQAAICRQFGAKSLLILAVHCDRQLSGVLQIFFDSPHHFTDPEVRVYQLLAGLVEAALSSQSEKLEVPLGDPFAAYSTLKTATEMPSSVPEFGESQIFPEPTEFTEPTQFDTSEDVDDPEPAVEPVAERPVPAFLIHSTGVSLACPEEEAPPQWIRPASLTMLRRLCDAGVAAVALLAVVSFLLYQVRTSKAVPRATSVSAKSVANHPLAVVPVPTTQPAAASTDSALSGARFVPAMPKHSFRSSGGRVEHLGDDVTIRYFPPKSAEMPSNGTSVRRISDDVTVRYFNMQAPGDSQPR